ncbi:helix-turn-helix domain-containing protein [Pseudomonas sp. ADAK13]|uniref:helix-turn-helix domain-containing protein n=1 Tax=unclassified Pseudomonas TaxID=196821 RepID=UPI000F05F6D1|nr:helix-turn-helix domain-containing protein [Pseudomonas sp. ADAK13]QJI34854.1 helix-turn-helix domain-containing protein [Pseudomonas sp. ADAK13]
MAIRFSKCPTWWIRDPQIGLIKFGGGKSAGLNIAALKCFLAISTSIDFHSQKAKLSISDLEALTGLSRPMVIRGLQVLVERGMVKVDKTAHIYEYELTSTRKDEGWGKIPYERIRKQLPEILNRGAIPLTALKIYLLLISLRPNGSESIPINYETMLGYLGCQRAHIRPALDILYSHTLVRITLEGSDARQRHNVYTILGI